MNNMNKEIHMNWMQFMLLSVYLKCMEDDNLDPKVKEQFYQKACQIRKEILEKNVE